MRELSSTAAQHQVSTGWQTEHRATDFDAAEDSPHGHGHRASGWGPTLLLSFSALGIVFGDIGTSPLYAYQAVFNAAPDEREVLSACSLFFWTLTLIVLVKYLVIVISFDDNGEGGTFALYALICRAAGFTPFGPAHPEELQLSGGGLLGGRALPPWMKRGKWWSVTNAAGEPLRRLYASSTTAQVALLVTVCTAAAMVIGDGVLTPSISVLSAVSGIKVAFPALQQGEIIGLTIAVLIVLFSVQYLGTSRISGVFAPVVAAWLLFNAGIGLYNLSTCGWGIWQAIGPHHAILAFMGPGGFVAGWKLLAGVMLAVTGAEACYSDLGHFSAASIRLSFTALVYPCLVLTYMGQASYLIKHPRAFEDPFWLSVPHAAFWPMLVVATAASVVASQALISGVFSIMRQAMNLGVSPRMHITNTDSNTEGQIYIRQVNILLLLGCIAMVAGFQDTTALGHAYGVAVMSVMFMTSILSGIVMLVCYSINPLLVAAFLVFYVPLEGLFLSSTIIKIPEGGWVTILIAAVVATINLIWWYGSKTKNTWYRAQAAKNRGMLAQLPLGGLAESGGGAENGDAAAHPAADDDAVVVSGGSRANSYTAAPGARHRSAAALPASLQHAASASLGSLSAGAAAPAGSAARLAGGADRNGDGSSSTRGGKGLQERPLAALTYTPGSAGRWGGQVLFDNKPLTRLPGLGIIYTQATTGLPAVLVHMLLNLPVLYDVTVLLTVRVLPRPWASQQERFLVRRSGQLRGVFRVIARHGYMERVDHGPAFVKQLLTCLVRFVAQEGEQQQQHLKQQPVAGAAAAVRALHGATAPSDAPAAGATAPLAPAGDAVIELQPAPSSAAGGPAAAASGGLGRWSRVPVAASEGEVLDEVVASTGPTLAARSFSRALSISASGGLDDSVAAAAASSAPSRQLLGRESFTRRQYSLQRRASTDLAPAGSDKLRVRSPVSHFHLGTIPADRVASEDPVPPQLAPPATAAGGGGGVAAAPSAAQLKDIEQLLSCFRTRAVYIMGRSQLAAALPRNSSGSSSKADGDDDEEAEPQPSRDSRSCFGAAAAYVRGWPKGVATGLYRVLSNNTAPSSESWQLPDDQLLLVAMVVRV